MKLPLKIGGITVKTPNGTIRQFSSEGAQRYADRLAKRHRKQPCKGLVTKHTGFYEIALVEGDYPYAKTGSE